MARMRVHELAKELNVNTKELIDRILKLGIPVKNHMSTLTDSSVERIREHFEEATVERVEKTRVARGVIRRRRTTTLEEFPAEAPAEAEQVEDAVGAAAEVPASEAPAAVEETGEVSEAVGPPEAPVEDVAVEPDGAVETEIQAKAVTEAPAVEPPSEEVEVATPLEAPAPVSEPVTEPVEAEAPKERPAAETSEELAEEAPEEVFEETEAAAEGEAAEVPAAVAAEGEEEEEEEEEDASKPKKAKRRRRKKRKEEPARIIRLPDIVPEEPAEEVDIPAPIARLKPDEQVSRESLRKKRVKEPAAREIADHKVRKPRKEVVGRENLYTKKELAAQAERGRVKDRRAEGREPQKQAVTVPKAAKRRVKIDEAITVANLAKQMGVKATEVIKKLLLLGLPANINQALDFDTSALVASEFGYEVERAGFEEEEVLQVQQDRPEDLRPRPPVVTVMGHVDHGKTSLLDAIRHSNVIAGEAGGITQHIGAYYVQLETGDVVFLDTPGHEAFTAMRARGAEVTDIVILVVAADDGVMQQTVEAINHSKAAGVPIIVAINKIDKPDANVERVKRELADHGLIPEEWGGDVTMVEISAKKGIGIDDLLEMVLLQAELMELKANPDKPARGHVIEAKLDKGRGPVATVLVQEGTLREGDVYVCGTYSGRVRSMFNDRGQRITVAGPAWPVEVVGLSGVPNAGDDFVVLADEKQAKAVAEHRQVKQREKELTRTTKVTLEKLYEQIKEGQIKEVNVILKTDVQGSLEAIADSLEKLSTPDVKVNLLHSGTGAISESDVMLASASNAIVIGFNVRSDVKALELAEQESVDIRYYDVIYQILNDIRDAMVGMLEPTFEENVIGRAEVRQTFHVSKVGTIAGCYVVSGKVERNAKVRVVRDGVVVYDGKIASLKRFKDDVKEVKSGFECGLTVDNFNDIKTGDILEAYEMVEIKPTLEPGSSEQNSR